ncbi:AHH domain-containing protein [Photorhabdus luminescens]|uniref:AHH domain-containing protein n=1 Tax=Photorhabdus luminescens TaxID=29488 RepID=UPI00223F4F74|nr:AHH domain-containing protein [Photorhabdus luminescens]MCW7764622.1 AHH domain-containing protein [Photorhabdus luminescens subsp. venezuelensis]
MAKHQGNHHGYTDAISNALDKINLNQSTDAISKQVTHIKNIAKKDMENSNIIKPQNRYNTNIQGEDVN